MNNESEKSIFKKLRHKIFGMRVLLKESNKEQFFNELDALVKEGLDRTSNNSISGRREYRPWT